MVRVPDALSALQMHVLAFGRGGSVFSWGTGTNGQLGHGTTESVPIPLLINKLQGKGVCQISCGGAHSAALCDNGDTFLWGWNNSGQLGLGDSVTKTVPTLNEALEPLEVSQISCGLSHTAILSNYDRCVYCFGWNQYNQLGTGALWSSVSEVRGIAAAFPR
jgi:alpha-tubulin suppressor-like RCC1 family protein